MTKWEYEWLSVPSSVNTVEGRKNLHGQLNALGRDGWEIYSVTLEYELVFWMRRPLGKDS